MPLPWYGGEVKGSQSQLNRSINQANRNIGDNSLISDEERKGENEKKGKEIGVG